SELEKQLGRKVSLGEMSLGFMPLRFQVANPVIAEDPAIRSEPPFVKAENLDIRIELLPLLRGAVRVESFELRHPSIELVVTKEGKWNFSTVGPTASNKPSTTASSAAPPEFSLQHLAVTDGQIGITDLRRSSSRTGYNHIDLTLDDFLAQR